MINFIVFSCGCGSADYGQVVRFAAFFAEFVVCKAPMFLIFLQFFETGMICRATIGTLFSSLQLLDLFIFLESRHWSNNIINFTVFLRGLAAFLVDDELFNKVQVKVVLL